MSETLTSKPSRPPVHFAYWLVALLLAGLLLYFSLRGIDWAQVWQILSHADFWLVGSALLIFSISLFLRAYRWRILLLSQRHISIGSAFWATAAGYFGNSFLPARAGEVVRTMMVSSSAGLSKMFVLTTALTERIADAITLVLISSAVLLILPVKPGLFDRAARPFAVIGFAGAVAILVIPKLEKVIHQLILRLPLPHAISDKVIKVLEQIHVGLRTFHDGRRLAGFVSLTMVIWMLDALGTLVGMHALGLTTTLAVALLLITGLGLGSALPSTPGYVGIYQFVAVGVLTPFGFSKTNAIAYILLYQALQYVLVTFWGLIAIARSRKLSFKTAPVQQNASPESVIVTR